MLCCSANGRKSSKRKKQQSAAAPSQSPALSPSQLKATDRTIERQGEDLHIGVSGLNFPDGSWLCGPELNCQWTTTKAKYCGKVGKVSAVDR